MFKESACQCRRHSRRGFDPWVGKIPWSRIWQPTAVFLPEKFHGQKTLEGCSPWGHRESDTTQQACAQELITHRLLAINVCNWLKKKTTHNKNIRVGGERTLHLICFSSISAVNSIYRQSICWFCSLGTVLVGPLLSYFCMSLHSGFVETTHSCNPVMSPSRQRKMERGPTWWVWVGCPWGSIWLSPSKAFISGCGTLSVSKT